MAFDRVLVTGSRTWTDRGTIEDALSEFLNPGGTLVHGACPTGADQIADELWSGKVERWPAEWERYGKRAGPLRNVEMVESGPDIVLAFVRNGSSGTTHCRNKAKEAGIPVVVYERTDSGF